MNNPPAFARTGDEFIPPQEGMELRDYFAAKAMAALIESLGDSEHRAQMLKEGRSMRDIPPVAYELADWMLAEREKGKAT